MTNDIGNSVVKILNYNGRFDRKGCDNAKLRASYRQSEHNVRDR